jgi:hypothetical protein
MKRAVIAPKNVVEKAEANRKQNGIGKQRFDHDRCGQRFWRARKCDSRSGQPDHQERKGEVAQDEPD